MQTKILKDRPTLLGGGAKEKLGGGGQLPPLPQSGYGPARTVGAKYCNIGNTVNQYVNTRVVFEFMHATKVSWNVVLLEIPTC